MQEEQFYFTYDTEVSLEQIATFKQEFVRVDEPIYGGCGLSLVDDLDQWRLINHDPEMSLPSDILFLVEATTQRLVGILHLRWGIQVFGRLSVGDIGFSLTPAFRGRGLSKVLMDKALNMYRQRGFGVIIITTRYDNEACKALIAKYGGVPVGTTFDDNNQYCNRYAVRTE